MKINEKTVDFVTDLVKGLDDTACVLFDRNALRDYIYRFHLTFQGQNVELEFDRALMDDF